MHIFIGQLGIVAINTAFVFALVAVYAYWQTNSSKKNIRQKSWKQLARLAFVIHSLAVFSIVVCLFLIVYNHYYEYFYAYNHSSNNLPAAYVIASFWNGQEGSFLLWIFWHVILGLALLKLAKTWEAPVMLVFSLVQAFLVSMLLGIVFFDTIKVGSSPFMLLREVMDAPVFKMNPDYIPTDGAGLNPLLQNYWMVIHPPTLFLGFAATLVPFSFCMAGLLNKQLTAWVKPALAWAHFAALVLGVGIMMGAYWAYETLNFGGYWNWDPVENAIYIPWIVLVASIHVMVAFVKNNNALKAAILLVIASFILILYATFLTRSGVLGESSVHSFTDLGLSGQLLLYLFTFLAIALFFLIKRWHIIPVKQQESKIYSREFWVFIGATTLCLMAFQVLVPTSIPVWNAFLNTFGITSKLAPPADQVVFYTKYQFWFAVSIAVLSGTGQFLFWNKTIKKRFINAITLPVTASLLLTALIIILAKIYYWQYIILLTMSMYALVANSAILLKLARLKVKLAAGAVAHIGVALLLLGILFSAGYSKVISLNMSGKIYNATFPEEVNRENLLLFRNHPKQMKDYTLVYKGLRMASRDIPFYIDKEMLLPTHDIARVVATSSIEKDGIIYASRGDTIHIYNENTYYEVHFEKTNGESFTLFPRVQDNPQMGLAYSPDIRIHWNKDLYAHLTTMAVSDGEITWSDPQQYVLSLGDTIIVNDYIAILDKVTSVTDLLEVTLDTGDVAIKAHLYVLGFDKSYPIEPIYLIKNRTVGLIPAINRDFGLRVKLEHINPTTGKFTISIATSQRDWIILKAIEKPYISLLWIGVVVMAIGFGMAIYTAFGNLRVSN